MANERTTLAWLRTAMALVGGAIALLSVTAALPELPRWAPAIAGISCLGGAALAVRAVRRWAQVERAMRQRQPLPAPRALVWLASGIGALAILVLALVVVELAR